MSAAFRNTSVSLSGRTVIVRGTIINQSKTNWSSADGWNTGYHLFDDPTDTLVIDGSRVPLDLAADAERSFETLISLPTEPGEYSVYVSAMQEHVAWFYTQNWPFVLVNISVANDGVASIRNWRMARQSEMRQRRLVRDLGKALTLPVQTPWRNRRLIKTLVRRDILSRYAGSLGGAFWAILNPLLLMLTYFFVFGLVLQSKVKGDPSTTGWAFYFLAGMLPWLAFSDALARAPGVLIEHRNFIRKLVFPVETLPVNLVITGLVTEFFGVILFLIGLFLVRGRIAPSLIYLPLVVIPQILLTAGLCSFLATMGVFVRDLAQINTYLLTIWFFVTPICYAESSLVSLPPAAIRLMKLNPMYVLVRCYRRILLEGNAPDWTSLGWIAALSVVVFVCGHAWFHRLRRSFADLI